MTVFTSSDPKDFDNPHWVGENGEMVEPPLPLEGLFGPEAQPERSQTPADSLGFVAIDSEEENLALRLLKHSKETVGGKEAGVARYLATIARNKKGGKDRAVRSIVRNQMINPLKSSLNHLNFLEGFDEHAQELGATVFEDDQYDDLRRDIVGQYFQARQRNNGVRASEQATLRQFLSSASREQVVALINETQANLENRATFWQSMLLQASEFYPMVKTMVDSENMTLLTPSR